MAKKPSGRMPKDSAQTAAAKQPHADLSVPAPAGKRSKDAAPLTDEERRAKKNASVREWRKAHKEEYAAYMKRWREKKQKQSGASRGKKEPVEKPTTPKTEPAKADVGPSGRAAA